MKKGIIHHSQDNECSKLAQLLKAYKDYQEGFILHQDLIQTNQHCLQSTINQNYFQMLEILFLSLSMVMMLIIIHNTTLMKLWQRKVRSALVLIRKITKNVLLIAKSKDQGLKDK